MKFMKLGSRPDTFFANESIRSISSEVSTDIKIQVQDRLYHLHKFPLLSKCGLLQTLCSKDSPHPPTTIYLSDIPGGADAFELCAKFCYSITITVSPLNFVPLRCAAEYLLMTNAVDRGNLAGKLESFFKSCILQRWKDTLLTLQSTRQFPPLCEDLKITSRCIDALAANVLSHPSKQWWIKDLAELSIDHYWRIMLAVKSAGVVSSKIVGEAIKVYASRWLPNMGDSLHEANLKHQLLLEKIVILLPIEEGSVSCSFLLKLLKAANILNASSTSKLDLARRAGVQLEEANVNDLLIASFTDGDEILYDVDVVITIVEEFMLQGRSPPTSPLRKKTSGGERRRSRSAENVDFEGQENGRRSSSASHSSMLRVAKLIDLYLLEIARNEKLPVEKVIALAKAVPDFARMDHDNLYRIIDTYLKAHPQLEKKERKKLCKIIDCKKLSMEACVHAAQNEMLPLRVVVQVLFFEQARAAMAGGHVTELPSNIKALLTKAAGFNEKGVTMNCTSGLEANDSEWSSAAGPKCQMTKVATLKMKLEEDDNDMELEQVMVRDGLMRSTSSRFRALCPIPSRPKRILSKIWTLNRSVSERL
ncbi:BTB/POZ domain-containing protein At1g67900 [Dendrobium catenatum]|uniref:BTB/POZ domain-containing protein n=1 Tax=Dendrobium catenatum TaxID=906689 RepID=A0A2I0X166_9ASPA|nr:BTB/POZ domain-containing protein At1g67900 [Dendrobium catenatum]PKU81650.1 BTB/POZ domain-containing protein [Dendrobium catenatum]